VLALQAYATIPGLNYILPLASKSPIYDHGVNDSFRVEILPCSNPHSSSYICYSLVPTISFHNVYTQTKPNAASPSTPFTFFHLCLLFSCIDASSLNLRSNFPLKMPQDFICIPLSSHGLALVIHVHVLSTQLNHDLNDIVA
jgi:hypothetical protein